MRIQWGLLRDLDLGLLMKYIVYHERCNAVNDFTGELPDSS